MTRRLRTALRLYLLVQARAFFPQVYVGVAVATVAALHLFVPRAYHSWLLPPLLLGEPATLALTLVAVQRSLERQERAVTALVVTPLRGAEYVAGLVGASVAMALLAGLVLQGGVIGPDARLLLLLPPLALAAAFSGLVALALSAYLEEFTQYLLKALVPSTLVLQLPLLAYFDLIPRASVAWLPTAHALFAFELLAGEFDAARYALHTAALLGFTGLAFAWALRCFQLRIRARLEAL